MNEALSDSVPPYILTIDLEDWFHGLEPDPGRWDRFPRRAQAATLRLLALLAAHRAKATFFVLGDVALACPDLVAEIAHQGHEIGSHGMLHRPIYTQTSGQFRDDLRRSLDLLESITATKTVSYRAPYFSIIGKSLWALDVLRDEGLENDSSIIPVRNPRYGMPAAPRLPYPVRPGLWEWPVSTFPSILGNVPFAGGAYLRLFPRMVLRHATRVLRKRRECLLFYLHPWELDPDQPSYRCRSPLFTFTHYYGLKSTCGKLTTILEGGTCTTLNDARNLLRPEGLADSLHSWRAAPRAS